MRTVSACAIAKSPDADRSRAPRTVNQLCMSHIAARSGAARVRRAAQSGREATKKKRKVHFSLLSKFPLAGGIYPPMTLPFAIVRTVTGITSERIFRARKPGCYITNHGITAGDGGQCREIPRSPCVLRSATVP